jgi:hypothetical protein
MSKFLLSLLFFSSTLQGAEGEFYIDGYAIKKLSVALPVRVIDFGDVYPGMHETTELVNFSVNAEIDYKYRIEISNDDNTGVVQVSDSAYGEYTPSRLTFNKVGEGATQQVKFYVGLNSKNISSDVSAQITILVAYVDIAGI